MAFLKLMNYPWGGGGNSLLAGVLFFSLSTFATPPETEWTVTGPKNGLLTVLEVNNEEGAIPWKFELNSSGRLTLKMTSDNRSGTSKALNFRTLPAKLPEGYSLKYLNSQSGVNRWYSFEQTTIEELYWPETINQVGNYNFYKCESLRICDYPEAAQITKIGDGAFQGCSNLQSFRMCDTITSIGKSAFSSCVKIVFEGPMLPAGITELCNDSFALGENAAPLADGLLVIGGSGDKFTWKVRTNNNYNRYFNRFNITNLIFGAGVSCAGTNTYNKVVDNPFRASNKTGSSITNIVVQNPGVFAFGEVLSQTATPKLTTVCQYDIAGWITGNLVANSTARKTRILAAKNKYWKAYKKVKTNYTPWSELSEDVQNDYWNYFNGGNKGSGDEIPLGLTKAVNYQLELDGETYPAVNMPANMWVVFKAGAWPDSGFKIIVR